MFKLLILYFQDFPKHKNLDVGISSTAFILKNITGIVVYALSVLTPSKISKIVRWHGERRTINEKYNSVAKQEALTKGK